MRSIERTRTTRCLSRDIRSHPNSLTGRDQESGIREERTWATRMLWLPLGIGARSAGCAEAVARVLTGQAASGLARAEHQEWYRELFAPSVTAGIIPAHALAGYRTHPVYIRGVRHVPPRADALADAMGTLFDLLENEPEPAVRAVIGHWALGYIHPWPDGNGRMARFLMNLMLCSGGYSWTVIRVEHRAEYMAALDEASSGQQIEPFARFLADRVAG